MRGYDADRSGERRTPRTLVEVPSVKIEADRVLLEIVQGLRGRVAQEQARYTRTAPEGEGLCRDCKFYQGDEKECLVVAGTIEPAGTSKYFSPWEEGLYPGDAVWEYIKRGGEKLERDKALVLERGLPGVQCGDCKYLLYWGGCLLVEGLFKPEMTCGYFVPIREGLPL